MQPTKEWLEKWEKVKNKLQPNSNIEDYFTLKEIAGKELDVMDIGPCSIPTGEFLVSDPMNLIYKKFLLVNLKQKFVLLKLVMEIVIDMQQLD